jgi:hypothetical protein
MDIGVIFSSEKQNIFYGGLDRANHVDLVQQIGFLAHPP